MNEVLISHATTDSELAGRLREMINRVSLGQIQAWYSSDRSGAGGLQPGDRWLTMIRERLASSKAVVTLVTPNSVGRPWIYFESGFGAAIADLEVVPVAVGVDIGVIPFPLAMYQVFRLTSKQDVLEFLAKLLHKFSLHFDEEMAEVVVRSIVNDIARLAAAPSAAKGRQAPESDTERKGDLVQVLAHIDKRFFDLARSLQGDEGGHEASYDIPILFERDSKAPFTQLVTIYTGQSLQDVLDDVYFKLGEAVEPFSYLVEWVLRERESGINLIVREVAHRIPAFLLLPPGSAWEVVYLNEPYSGASSTDAILRGRGVRDPDPGE